ncbi:MAG: STAS domain-containing protein [Thermodesulfobacteriota bacterium]|nr:STAS domain-containing protein [Thermodesulfobacteriota bacterium]
MKIKTEIINKILVVTCEGSRFDASFAQDFVKSMQYYIQKGCLDIVLDLSSVEFVDSTGLGAIVRCLKELNGRGHLVLCGVNVMVLSLFKMTHLDNVFIQAADRSEAFRRLDSEKKKRVRSPSPLPASSRSKGFDEALLASLSMEGDGPVRGRRSRERRKYQRIDHKQILNEDIIFNCINQVTGQESATIVLDISAGGVLMVSHSSCSVGDELILEGRIGTNFKFRERAVIRNCRQGKYGIEFVKPSEKTTSFLQQLTGAVMMGNI